MRMCVCNLPVCVQACLCVRTYLCARTRVCTLKRVCVFMSRAHLEHEAKAKDERLGGQEVLAAADHKGPSGQVLACGCGLGHLQACACACVFASI